MSESSVRRASSASTVSYFKDDDEEEDSVVDLMIGSDLGDPDDVAELARLAETEMQGEEEEEEEGVGEAGQAPREDGVKRSSFRERLTSIVGEQWRRGSRVMEALQGPPNGSEMSNGREAKAAAAAVDSDSEDDADSDNDPDPRSGSGAKSTGDDQAELPPQRGEGGERLEKRQSKRRSLRDKVASTLRDSLRRGGRGAENISKNRPKSVVDAFRAAPAETKAKVELLMPVMQELKVAITTDSLKKSRQEKDKSHQKKNKSRHEKEEDAPRRSRTKSYKPSPSDMCSFCNQHCSGMIFVAGDKHKFHMECVSCFECGAKSSKRWHFVDGRTLCDDSFNRLHVHTCQVCGEKATANDKLVRAKDMYWHADCFECSTCAKPLITLNSRGKKIMSIEHFSLKGGQVLCEQHGSKRSCGGCGEYVDLGAPGLKAQLEPGKEKKIFHMGCFKCETCDKTIASLGGSYFVWEGGVYCSPHYSEVSGMVCSICNKVLSPGSLYRIGSGDQKFHAECVE